MLLVTLNWWKIVERSIIIIDAILFEEGSVNNEIAIGRRIFSEERNC